MPPWLKNYFGDEYPAAAIVDGVRMPLVFEHRWTRSYENPDRKMGTEVSRFMDGSATITFEELARDWSTWSERDRRDFCGACSWLHRQSDYPDILRHIMQHGDPDNWSAIASPLAVSLPQEEAFNFLTRVLHSTELGNAGNIAQGIAATRHPDAEAVLRTRLAALWSQPSLWDNEDCMNLVAHSATSCIQHLIELGAPPADFSAHVRQLAGHACSGNREICRNFLRKHYSWLD